VLRRTELMYRLQPLEPLDSAHSPLGAESNESEIAEAAIARAMAYLAERRGRRQRDSPSGHHVVSARRNRLRVLPGRA
jgi:hypothetical protein